MSGGGSLAAVVVAILAVVTSDVWVGIAIAVFVLCVAVAATIHSNRKEQG